MFGTYCVFSTGSADSHFRPITRESWCEPCFAPVRYNLEKLFGSKESVEELFEFLWAIDETLTTVCDWKLNDALGRKTFYNEMQSLLIEQRIINTKVGVLRPEFKIICDESVNSLKVIEENKLLALLSLRREGSMEWPVQLLFRFEYVNKG